MTVGNFNTLLLQQDIYNLLGAWVAAGPATPDYTHKHEGGWGGTAGTCSLLENAHKGSYN
jgi:hypothetical protein